MKRSFTIILILASLGILAANTGFCQLPEDAIRPEFSGIGVGARALSLGMAYNGIANDFSAVYWNPAGLGQMRMSEFSFGLSNMSLEDNSTFLGNSQSYNNSSTNLNAVGLVYPFPTAQGSLVFALGYNRVNDYTGALSFEGFNPSSSIVPSLYNADASSDLAWLLYLENADGIPKVDDSMYQKGKVLESGGLNHWLVSGAAEVAQNLYLGVTLNFLSGSYTYRRDYTETDTKYHTNPPYELSSLDIINSIQQDISGINAKFGLMYVGKKGRIGLTIQTPSYVSIKENSYDDGVSKFRSLDTAGHYSESERINYNPEYDVVTPFIFSGGGSYSVQNLMLTGQLDYEDWSQAEFRNTDPTDIMDVNNPIIKEEFRPTVNLHVGAEYDFVDPAVRLRGGFAFLPSPYSDDDASFAQKYVTAGIGFIIENSVGIDIGYAYGYWNTNHQIYNDVLDGSGNVIYSGASTQTESVHTHNLITTLSYRF